MKKQRNGTVEVDAAALNRLLAGLVAMRDGNFRRMGSPSPATV